MRGAFSAVVAVAAFVTIATLALVIGSCTGLPEYAVSVQADPDVTWSGWLSVERNIGPGEARHGNRVPVGAEESSLDSWGLSLKHETEDGSPGRITAVSLKALKIAGDGSVRVTITRNGEVVAQGETDKIGAAAFCEWKE